MFHCLVLKFQTVRFWSVYFLHRFSWGIWSLAFLKFRSMAYIWLTLLSFWIINLTDDQNSTRLSLQTINISIGTGEKDEFPLHLVNRVITASVMDGDKAISSISISKPILWLDIIWVRDFSCLLHSMKRMYFLSLILNFLISKFYWLNSRLSN